MAKITLIDLANALKENNNLSTNEADNFVVRVFEVIKKGIEKDGLTKVKGLGTFKVIDVDARESVNVNTGERVLIDSHGKVTFTPDAVMKDLVNKPFADFETVVLNEGVDFSDEASLDDLEMQEEPVEETVAPDEETAAPVEETVAPDEETAAPIEETAATDEETAAPVEETAAPVMEEAVADENTIEEVAQESVVEEFEPETEEPSQASDEPASAEEPAPVQDSEPAKEIHGKPEEDMKKNTIQEFYAKWRKPAGMLLVGIIIGYFIGTNKNTIIESFDRISFGESDKFQIVNATVEENVVLDTLDADSVSNPAAVASVGAPAKEVEKAAADTTKTIGTDIASSTDKTRKSIADDTSYLKYEQMDERVRTGAYYIMGVAEVVKAREGETLARISRRYLGEGMSCYVEVLNGLDAKTTLTAGQEVKIPKLVHKRKIKNQQE